MIAEHDHLKVGERRLIKGGGHALICRMIAHYPTVETKKLFINAASIKPINPWKKVNLQKAELHSQCYATLICIRVTSAVCADNGGFRRPI